jgi:hypothetical protein
MAAKLYSQEFLTCCFDRAIRFHCVSVTVLLQRFPRSARDSVSFFYSFTGRGAGEPRRPPEWSLGKSIG